MQHSSNMLVFRQPAWYLEKGQDIRFTTLCTMTSYGWRSLQILGSADMSRVLLSILLV
jgi:hypothetical protein